MLPDVNCSSLIVCKFVNYVNLNNVNNAAQPNLDLNEAGQPDFGSQDTLTTKSSSGPPLFPLGNIPPRGNHGQTLEMTPDEDQHIGRTCSKFSAIILANSDLIDTKLQLMSKSRVIRLSIVHSVNVLSLMLPKTNRKLNFDIAEYLLYFSSLP